MAEHLRATKIKPLRPLLSPLTTWTAVVVPAHTRAGMYLDQVAPQREPAQKPGVCAFEGQYILLVAGGAPQRCLFLNSGPKLPEVYEDFLLRTLRQDLAIAVRQRTWENTLYTLNPKPVFCSSSFPFRIRRHSDAWSRTSELAVW